MAHAALYCTQTIPSPEVKSKGTSITNISIIDFLVFIMFLFTVIAATAVVANGANLCPSANDRIIKCPGQGYTAIPALPSGAVEV